MRPPTPGDLPRRQHLLRLARRLLLGLPPPATRPLERLKRYLYHQGTDGTRQLIPDRYEALVYRLVRNGLAAGDLVCHESVQYRSFADELLSDQQWREKARLLERIGLTHLQQPIQHQLTDLETQLEDRLRAVNARIVRGENTHVQVTRRGERTRWTLEYPRDMKQRGIR